MRLRRCPVGVKVRTLFRHVRGLGFDSRVRTLFSIYLFCIYLVFTFVHRLLSACTLKRGAPSTASCLTHTLPQPDEPRQHYTLDHTSLCLPMYL